MSPSGRFQVVIDASTGGRWSSLRDPFGREWLWHRGYPADARDRAAVVPGDDFVDIGGVEECFPTITGSPDHGDVWSRAWASSGDEMSVSSGDFTLTRRVVVTDRVLAHYRLHGPPGAPFLWAFHALLRPDQGLTIEAPVRRCRSWTSAGELVETSWPSILDVDDCDVLGPDDGTAVFGVLDDLDSLQVSSGSSSLHFELDCAAAPVSMGIWRNLAGFPTDGSAPYRSLGVEPMLGRAPCLGDADSAEVARIPGTGTLSWRLVISAEQA